MKNLKNNLVRLINFLSKGVWNMRLKDLSGTKYFLIRQLRIYVLAVKGFYEDKCQLRASALTFYSLLSVVPILAMAFGVAKGFGLDKLLERELKSKLTGQKEVLQWLIDFAHKLLENTEGTLIAGLGLIVLIWSVMKVLGMIERSFNDVWQIKKGRPIGRRFSDYLAIMILGPLLMISSSSLTVFVTTQITEITEQVSILGAISPFIFFLLKKIPYLLIWILFTFIYIFMPNTHVKFKSGLIAGIVAGTIYQLGQWAYIEFQVGVSAYNTIYGSFAALPLFLIWLQISWLIVLFGAEISFAEQNVDNYEFEAESTEISYNLKRLLSLYICHLIIWNFSHDEKPLRSQDISQKLEIPIRLVRNIVFSLINCGILSEVQTKREKESAYQPAHDTNKLSIQYIVNALETEGSDKVPVLENKAFEHLKKIMQNYKENLSRETGNILIKDIKL